MSMRVCHTPAVQRRVTSTVAALNNKAGESLSDLLSTTWVTAWRTASARRAGPREFRNGAVWGLGQRVFFCTTGGPQPRARHSRASSNGSEANA